jgi:transposase
LIALVKVLLTQIASLETRVAEWKAKLPPGTPPATSRNSSQPPSRDQKSNLVAPKGAKRIGAKPGHVAATRPLVENPDRIIEVKADHCANCHTDLRDCEPARILRHQITELPVIVPLVIETQIHEAECPHCHTVQRATPPVGLEPTRCFGPRLEATVGSHKHTQHLSYERQAAQMHDLFGVSISAGGLNAIVQRSGALTQPKADAIRAAVARSPIIGSDETSARVNGRNCWQWVFRSAAGVFHRIVPTRSAAVVEDFMGEQCADVWVSDCYSAQLLAPAKTFQLGLAHQTPNLESVIQIVPGLLWLVRVPSLFQAAIHLRNRFFTTDELTLKGYLRRVAELENRLDTRLTEDQTGTAAQQLYQRYVKHRDHLLVFLQEPEVPPTNNACESALRPCVIHRRVTNGFRSERGAQGYAALATVLEIAKLQGRNLFDTLVELMGQPVLHYLNTS